MQAWNLLIRNLSYPALKKHNPLCPLRSPLSVPCANDSSKIDRVSGMAYMSSSSRKVMLIEAIDIT